MAVRFFKKGAGRVNARAPQKRGAVSAGRRCMSFLLAFAMAFSVAAVGLTGPIKAAVEKATLRFDKNGEFKILQIADVQENYHDDKDTALAKKTYQMIQQAISFSDPDLVVFTGDQLDGDNNSSDIESCIQTICKPVVDAGVPFMICFGNHDYSDGGFGYGDVSKGDQVKMYQAQRGCLALLNDPDYPSGGDGKANQYLTIKSSQDSSKDAYNLWFFDSLSSRGEDAKHVTQEQINWYKMKSSALAAANGGAPLPSIVFQHIPVPEIYQLLEESNDAQNDPTGEPGDYGAGKRWKLKAGTTGQLGEAPTPNGYSYPMGMVGQSHSAQYQSWLDQGDVQGAFFGHDHLNDISGQTEDGITLTQCKSIGTVSNYHNDNCDLDRVPAALQSALAGTNGYRTITIYEETDTTPAHFETESVYEKMIASGPRLDLSKLEAALDLFPTYADSYYTQETINAFHTAKDTAKTRKREAGWRPYQAYDGAKQEEINRLADTIETAYANLEATTSPTDLDRLTQPEPEVTMGTTGVIRVGAADNSLDKQEYGNTIQEYEIDYVNHTGVAKQTVVNEEFPTKGWKSTEPQRTITFEKQGTSNIRIENTGYYGPKGAAPNPTIQFTGSGQGVSNSAQWVISGTAYAGTSLEFTITYDYNGHSYSIKKYMYVDTIISPPGWNTFTTAYNRLTQNRSDSLHLSTLTSSVAGVSVYSGAQSKSDRTGDPIGGNDFNNQTGYFPYGTATDDSNRGFGDQQFVAKGWAPYSDPTNPNDPSRYYGLIQWSPEMHKTVSDPTVWYSGQTAGKDRSKSGNRAKAEVYINKGKADVISFNLTFWMKENVKGNSGNPLGNGLYITNWDGDSRNDQKYQNWGDNVPSLAEEASNWSYFWGNTSLQDNAPLTGRGSSVNYTITSSSVPADGSVSTVVSQFYTSTKKENETYNAWLLNFHVFDTTQLHVLVQAENEMNRQRATYRDIGRDGQPDAFGRYLEALKGANYWLVKPDANQQDIDDALQKLQDMINNLIRIYILDIETLPEKVNLTYEMDNAQATVLEQEIALNPVVSSGIPTNYAQLQVNGSVSSTSFVLTNSVESPVRFEVIDNKDSAMQPGECIGDPAKGLREGIYTDYGITVKAIVDDTTPAGIYTGYLTIQFVNAPQDGSYAPEADSLQQFPVTIPIHLEIRSTYMVTIPADTQIPFFQEYTVLGGEGINFTAKAQIPSGDRVAISIDEGQYADSSSGKRRLGKAGNDQHYLPYALNERLFDGEGHLSRKPFSSVTLTMGSGNSFREASLEAAISQEDWKKVPIDIYSDQLTFTVNYEQNTSITRSIPRSGLILKPSILLDAPNTAPSEKSVAAEEHQESVSVSKATATVVEPVSKAAATVAPATTETTAVASDMEATPAATGETELSSAPATEPAPQKETATIPPAPTATDPEEIAEPGQ